MRSLVAISLIVALLAVSMVAQAQSGPSLKKEKQTSTSQPAKKNEPPAASDGAQEETETVKVETNLVTIPVIVSDRGDRYVGDLRRDEFRIFEDGVEQQVAYFDSVTAPFHVVLMLDTSASTQEKLNQIQRAAITFTEELQAQDRVKVISFEDRIRDLCDFSSDRAVIQWAIKSTQPGKGTKLYDAVALAINKLQSVKGRKAIVIFTDGVDSYSDRETYDKNRKAIQESGIIVYPIRFDTREDVERLARQQQRSGQVVDLASILGGGGGTGGGGTTGGTPKTFPSEDKDSGPLPPTIGGPTTIGVPGILGKIRVERDGPTQRDDNRDPSKPDASSRYPTSRDPSRPDRQPSPNEHISEQLDRMYETGDAYLNDLATESGGTLYRADTLFYLPDAFAKIAAELRTQYAVGYYPAHTARDGKYRKIQVKVSRKDVSVRARPGYRARAK